MRLFSRKVYTESNLVRNPPDLPGHPYGKGSIEISEALESVPTAAISLTIIPEDRIQEIRDMYRLGTVIVINGFNFKVVGYSDSRENLPAITKRQKEIPNTYEVEVDLDGQIQGQIEKDVKMRPLVRPRGEDRPDDGLLTLSQLAVRTGATLLFDASVIVDGSPNAQARTSLDAYLTDVARVRGGVVRFSNPAGVEIIDLAKTAVWQLIPDQIIDNGTLSVQYPPVYSELEITGDFSNRPDDNDDEEQIAEQPEIEVLITEDENPDEPPLDSVFLRDVTSNHDLSGPTKSRVVTTNINGAPALTEKFLFGFAYTGEQIHLADGEMLADTKDHWQVVDYKLENFVYEKLRGGITLTVDLFEPGSEAFRVPIYIDPDVPVDGTVKIIGDRSVGIFPKTEYLTDKEGRGWIKTRFQTESGNGDGTVPETIQQGIFDNVLNTGDPDQVATYRLFQFFDLAVNTHQSYELETERRHYIDNVAEPATFEIAKVSDLSVGKVRRMKVAQTSAHGYIAIARPAQNFTENMLVLKEGYDERGFALTPHPENTPTTSPQLPPYIVGKDVINRNIRTVLVPKGRTYKPPRTPEKWEDFSSSYNSQDAGFDTSLALKVRTQNSGRPPSASTRMFEFETKMKKKKQRSSSRYRFFVSSDREEFSTRGGGSQSYPQAITAAQGVTAALTTLNLAQYQSTSVDKVVTWYFPTMKAGDRVTLEGVTYIILGLSYKLNYEQGKVISAANGQTYLDCPVTCDGMNLNLSEYIVRQLFVTRRPDDQYGGDSDEKSPFSYNGGGLQLGQVPEPFISRTS